MKPDTELRPEVDDLPEDATRSNSRKRPKPGERKIQILQALAQMLESPAADRVTTAALAARIGVSEAALYRHFASKAQMYEGLIEFIEQSLFGLVRQVKERESDPGQQLARILALVLQFAEKNPGMVRVMVGDALVGENERLNQRMIQLFDRLEVEIKQSLRQQMDALAHPSPTVEAQARASALTALLMGRMQRYARSGFKRMPAEQLDALLAWCTRP